MGTEQREQDICMEIHSMERCSTKQVRQEMMISLYLGMLTELSARSKSFTQEMETTKSRWEEITGIHVAMEGADKIQSICLQNQQVSIQP